MSVELLHKRLMGQAKELYEKTGRTPRQTAIERDIIKEDNESLDLLCTFRGDEIAELKAVNEELVKLLEQAEVHLSWAAKNTPSPDNGLCLTLEKIRTIFAKRKLS